MKIKNWSKYQSYKDRKPPWIRFHRAIIDDYKFQMMSADARALLPMFWLLACENEDPVSGIIDIPIQEIAFRLRQDKDLIRRVIVELQSAGFIECIETVTEPLQDRTSPVTPETETETETETDNTLVEFALAKPDRCVENPPALKSKAEKKSTKKTEDAKEVFEYWQSVMGHKRAKLDNKRKTKILARFKDGYTVADLKAAVDGCKLSPHHMGQNRTGTIYDDLELICRDGPHVDKFLKLSSTTTPTRQGLSIAGQRTAAAAERLIARRLGNGA